MERCLDEKIGNDGILQQSINLDENDYEKCCSIKGGLENFIDLQDNWSINLTIFSRKDQHPSIFWLYGACIHSAQ